MGGDTEAHFFELAQFIDRRVDSLGTCPLGIENRLGIVKDYEHLLGRKEGPQGCQVLRVFNPCTDDLGELGKEMGAQSQKLVTADESAVLAELFFNPIVVEDGEGDRYFPD